MRFPALESASELARSYLEDLDERPVFPAVPRHELRKNLSLPLPDSGMDETQVLAELARDVEPGLVHSQGGRYFGFVTGGAFPVAVGADWLGAAWDQNCFSYVSSPAMSVVEEVVERWLIELLGLPSDSAAAFVTGCQMAHVTALGAARQRVMAEADWDVASRGLYGAPPIAVVTGDMRHVTVDRALRLLGMGTDSLHLAETDASGRIVPEALQRMVAGLDGPLIVVAQAGEVNTGSFDPFTEISEIATEADAWLHIDGAFGLWARVAPTRQSLAVGVELADSWAFDAHKWLNVPYDSGVAIVRDREALQSAMSLSGPYLITATDSRDSSDWTPEASRRARGLAIYAVVRSLGRQGIVNLVERCCAHARALADGLADLDLEILNDVVLNQVLVRSVDDEATDRLLATVQDSGEAWMGGTTWDERRAIRISVSGWRTADRDVDRTIKAFRAALATT